jgi:hypothetical protein
MKVYHIKLDKAEVISEEDFKITKNVEDLEQVHITQSAKT